MGHAKPTLLLIDFNSIFYRGMHVNKTLSHKGNLTGGLFGFINQVASTINETKPSLVIVCDDVKPYTRAKVFPAYKSDRTKDRSKEELETMQTNRDASKTFLKMAGIPVISRQGMEADDVIALIAGYHNREYKIIIASNDTDLYQLLDYADIYNGIKKGIYNRRKFFSEYQQMRKVKDWVKVSAIAGSHNGIPQLAPRIGEKTAIKLLNLRNKRKDLEALLAEHRVAYERNLMLCKLPYPGSRPIKFLPKMEHFDYRCMITFLNKYGIQISGPMLKALERDYV